MDDTGVGFPPGPKLALICCAESIDNRIIGVFDECLCFNIHTNADEVCCDEYKSPVHPILSIYLSKTILRVATNDFPTFSL